MPEIENKIAVDHADQVPDQISDKDLAKVDTVHNDEAVVVLAGYHGDQTWTDAEEKALRRKIDWKIMPVLCLTYSLQYYDKAMLGQAALFGLRTDLGLLIGDRYSIEHVIVAIAIQPPIKRMTDEARSSAIFYLGFICGSYPSMVLAQRYPVERVAAALVTVWGLCQLLTTQCHNYQGLYIQRFFLGILEAGISPMFMLVVGSWYKKTEQAWRMGIWYSCTGYVSIFSPLINYAWGQINGGVSSWRYMFYFAGGITILWGVALLWVLPGEPIKAKGLSERERFMAVARLRSNNAGVRNTHFKLPQVKELLLDIHFWLCFWAALLIMICNGPISTFLPIIINSFGFSTLNSLLLMMPCGFWSGTVTLACCWLSYRVKNVRVYLFIAAESVTILSSLLLLCLPRDAKGGLLFAAFILPSVGGAYAVLMGLEVANTAGYTKKSIASAGLFIGYCLGNFIGPLIFRPVDAPRYIPGWIVVIVTTFISILCMILYRILLVRENRRRDAQGAESFDNAFDDDFTDKKNPQFRYIM